MFRARGKLRHRSYVVVIVGQDVEILDSGVLQGQVLRTVSDAGFSCHEVFYPAGTRLGPHGHCNALFALPLEGNYRESACGREFECSPRAVVFDPARQEHAVVVGAHPLRCFVLEIDVEEMRCRYGAAAPRSLFCGTSISALMTRLYAEFRLGDAPSVLAMQGLLLEILAFASRNEPRGSLAGCPTWLASVDEILRERFRSRLKLEEIASEIGISPQRL